MKKIYFIAILYCFVSKLSAQSTLDATGDNYVGSGGSVSFSVGQITYNTITNEAHTIYEGVQHPIELYKITASKDSIIDLNFLVFPNPTYDLITLQVGSTDLKNLSYQLVDILGRVIETKIISNYQTEINMSDLSAGTYVLNIISKQKSIKYFKIIKL
jgi:hypothetical protein